jgi:hypothetical protein
MVTDFSLTRARRICSLLTLLLVFFVTVPGQAAIDETVEQLRLDYAAFRAAEDDYRKQRQFNGLDGADAADYAEYVARLQRRVFEDCQAVIRAGSSLPEGFPCPAQGMASSKSADIATEKELTTQEQIAALDRALNRGLGEYDEKLLREQERIKASTPNDNRDGGGDGGASGTGEGSEGDGSEGGGSDGEGSEGEAAQGQGSEREGGEPGGSAGGNREGDRTGARRAGGPEDSSTDSSDRGRDTEQPSDIPDGSDDDVVARQLREAAEKETDPELKAKLWEEYRRYKRGTT